MRRIVLYISLVLTLVGCSGEEGGEYHYQSIASLWSYARRGTTLITDDIYLSGYVVANDKLDELRRAIVVADGSAGVVVEVDMDDTQRHIPLYSRVAIRCAGLWLGSVGPKLILGTEPLGESVVNLIPSAKVGNYITILSYDENTPTLRSCKVAELGYRDMLCRVAVADLRLVEEEWGMRWAALDSLTGRCIATVRHFCQGGDTLRVVTDGHCRYALEYIPTSNLRLSGILDWYDADLALRIINHAIDRNY